MSKSEDYPVNVNMKQKGYSINSIEIKKQCNVINKKVSKNIPKRYSTSVEKPLKGNVFKKEGIFLSYKAYVKKQERLKHKQNLAVSLYDKYKIIFEDLHTRLHVSNPSDDVHTMKDIDPDFFKCVSGRPCFQYTPPFKSLIYLFNKQLRFNEELGHVKDSILNITENHRKEGERYEKAMKQYLQQTKNFESFISYDYYKSMRLLADCDALVTKVNSKIAELHSLAIKKFTITSRMMGLNYMYGHQQKYGRFLYYLSPPLWRLKNREFAHSVEIEAKGFDFGTFSDEDTFNVIFENMKKECARGLVKPALYFKCPDDLLKVFTGIEKQQLNHFTHVVNMSPQTKSLRDKIAILKDGISQDTAGISNEIKSFDKILEFYEEVCSELKVKFFKLIHGAFFDNVGAYDVLKLQLHLEFCYENLYLDKPTNMDLITMARAIELFNDDYNKRLEAIHNDKIKTAVLHNLQAERKKFRMAKNAERELKLFGRLERALQRACEPVVGNQFRMLPAIKLPLTRKKSRRLNSQVSVKKNSSPVLTEAEREYLTLFTDWTKNEDPAKYLQSLSISNEEKASS